MENRKELSFDLITDLEGAKPAMERMVSLSAERLKLIDRLEHLRVIKNHVEAQKVGYQINRIKIELSLIRETIEYVRIKSFILCAKSYLTKDQMKEIGERADNLLLSPELYLVQKSCPKQ